MHAIVGGMFDPIHFGHYKPALELMPVLGLTEIRLIPCHHPPHRKPTVASAEQRWHMVQQVADGKRLVADDRELRRTGPSYTYETLCSLRDEQIGPLCLLIGADVLAGLPNWYRADELLGLCHIVVLARSGVAVAELPSSFQTHWTEDLQTLKSNACGSIYLYQGTLYDLSSTQIRELIQRGETPRYCLPGPVWAYIQQQHLYDI